MTTTLYHHLLAERENAVMVWKYIGGGKKRRRISGKLLCCAVSLCATSDLGGPGQKRTVLNMAVERHNNTRKHRGRRVEKSDANTKTETKKN